MKAVDLLVAIAIVMVVSGCVGINSRSQPSLAGQSKLHDKILPDGMPLPMHLPAGAAEPKQTQAKEQSATKQAQPRESETEYNAAKRELAERFPCAEPLVSGRMCGSPEEHSLPSATDTFRCVPMDALTIIGRVEVMGCTGCEVASGHPVIVRQHVSTPLFPPYNPRPDLGDLVEVVVEHDLYPNAPPYLLWARGQDLSCPAQSIKTSAQQYAATPNRDTEDSGQLVRQDSARDPRQSVLIDEAAKLGFNLPNTQSTLIAGGQRDAMTCGEGQQFIRVMQAVSPEVVAECALTPCPWDQDNLSCGLARLGFDAQGDLRYFSVTLNRKDSRPHENDYINRFEQLYGNTNRKVRLSEEFVTIANEVTVRGVGVSLIYMNKFKEHAETMFLIYAIR